MSVAPTRATTPRDQLRAYKDAEKLSTRALAERITLSPHMRTVERWLRGESPVPTAVTRWLDQQEEVAP